VNPFRWPKHFAEELRKLNGYSQGCHVEAIDLVLAAPHHRRTKEGVDAVAHITSGDVKGALERWTTAETAVQEVRREAADNATFTGGLGESLADIANAAQGLSGGGVVVNAGGGFFDLPLLDSTRQPEE
jgi:hypothetical protein